MKAFRNWSLFSKIYLFICLVLAITIALNAFFDVLLSDRILHNEVRQLSLEAAQNVVRDLSDQSNLDDPLRLLVRFLAFLEINPSISRVDAYQLDGDVFRGVVSTSKAGPPNLQTAEINRLIAGETWQEDQIVAGELCLRTLLPLKTQGEIVGAVSLLTSQRELAALRVTHWRVALRLIPLATGFLVLMIYLVLQRGLKRRMDRIINSMGQVRDGHLDVRIPYEGSDELGIIGSHFNEMITAVHAAAVESKELHRQLDSFNQGLQKRVEQAGQRLEEKYRELQETNEELMSVQMRLARAERHAVAGQVATTFAHEVGSPLSAVSTQLQLLLEDPSLSQEAHKRADTVYQQIERVVGIVEQLLATSRPKEVLWERVNLMTCLSEILELSQQDLTKRNILLQDRRAPDLPPIRGNTQQLQQVFLNLVNNATDAMKDGGTLTIESNVRHDSRPPAVELLFCDNGPGIPEDQLEKIFKPFFTTKGTGKGTGLGLAVSAEIARRHGGQLEVQSEEGEGATFIVRLPLLGDRGQESRENRDHEQYSRLS